MSSSTYYGVHTTYVRTPYKSCAYAPARPPLQPQVAASSPRLTQVAASRQTQILKSPSPPPSPTLAFQVPKVRMYVPAAYRGTTLCISFSFLPSAKRPRPREEKFQSELLHSAALEPVNGPRPDPHLGRSQHENELNQGCTACPADIVTSFSSGTTSIAHQAARNDSLLPPMPQLQTFPHGGSTHRHTVLGARDARCSVLDAR
ncbi:uncharacterized protein UV8b_01249 [Ustilaginoidea virens]|uniref:Uncharacterized protein n=1 Tax=Ustilaginoidea virens TaxID=1159556 RepID=A0A8E5HKM9_USTVR|nr:uncharacterized protein UV8b_01249 [Ustilaginoidea virens]QUC17008.1 hypothetical protein UV8b_01249 [Ustilaginoidea virens]